MVRMEKWRLPGAVSPQYKAVSRGLKEAGTEWRDTMGKDRSKQDFMRQAKRWCVYVVGMCVLAGGISLNTRTGLGVSPIVSVSFCMSELKLLPLNFGDMTFLLYALFVAIQLPLRKGRERIAVLLQLAISWVFSCLLNAYGSLITYDYTSHGLPENLAVLVLAITLTGIGASMSINMRLIPNPADGLVQVLAEKTGWTQGLTKNIFDISCVGTACVIGFVFAQRLVGIGLGTVLAMLGVGRVIALVNRLAGKKMQEITLKRP